MWKFLKWSFFAVVALVFGMALVQKIQEQTGEPDEPPAASNTSPWEARDALRQAIASTGRACSAVLKTTDRTEAGDTVWIIECQEAKYLIRKDADGDAQIADCAAIKTLAGINC